MSRVKHLFAVVLAALMLCLLMPVAAFAEEASDGKMIVYAKLPSDWSDPHLWAWADDGTNAFDAWPGGEMEADSNNDGWYYCWIPETTNNIIINANDAAVQTSDYKLESKNAWVTVTDAENVEISYDAQTTGDLPEYVEKFKIHAQVPDDWQDVDFLGGMLNGENISVYASTEINTTASIALDGGEVGVWQYDAAASAPEIGNVVSTMGRAGNRVYIYGDGLDGNISVKFGETEATVESNTANEIVTYVPDNAVAGYNDITVTKGDAVSNSFTYNVLSGDQNQVIFHVKAETNYGENIYIVGNVPELGSWDPDKCTEALLNPNYPEWFLPVSVPAGTEIQFKFIKKDANGTVTWESGDNRVITSSSLSAGTVDTEVYTWRN